MSAVSSIVRRQCALETVCVVQHWQFNLLIRPDLQFGSLHNVAQVCGLLPDLGKWVRLLHTLVQIEALSILTASLQLATDQRLPQELTLQ